MAITDYSPVASNNTTLGTIGLAENGMSVGDINDAFRTLMADIATGRANGDFAEDAAALDPTLVALAGLATGSDKLAYSTGTDTFAQTDFTSFGRTLAGLADVAALKSLVGGLQIVSSQIALNGHVAFDLTGNGSIDFQINWGTGTFGTSTSFQKAFSSAVYVVVPFPTGLISEGDESDENMYVSSKSVSGFNTAVSGDYNSLPSLNYIALGR